MFDVDEFAETVTLDGNSVDVLFFDPWEEDQEVSGVLPTATAPTEKIPDAAIGQALVRGTVTKVNYTVVDVQPTGDGVTTLVLRRD